jgi:hypothetical protein
MEMSNRNTDRFIFRLKVLLPDNEESDLIKLLRAGGEAGLKGCVRALAVAVDSTPFGWFLLVVAVVVTSIVTGCIGFAIGLLYEKRKSQVNISFVLV